MANARGVGCTAIKSDPVPALAHTLQHVRVHKHEPKINFPFGSLRVLRQIGDQKLRSAGGTNGGDPPDLYDSV